METGSEVLIQETRRWDDNRGETFSMREKETAADYRYFPNPEIMPIVIDNEWIEKIRASLPEMAHEKFLRMTTELSLSEYDSRIITGSKNLSDIFENTLKYFNKPKEAVNWIIGDLLSIATGDNKGEEDIKIDCRKFAKLMELVDSKTINRTVGKKMLIMVLKDDIDPETYVAENKLAMVSDMEVIEKAVLEVLAVNEKDIIEYKNGNQKALNSLVGQTMKKLGGKADPQIVNKLLKENLGG